jgi:ABC-type bacteriocin/lantibiotic exporter with double-glycine peptidase domain
MRMRDYFLLFWSYVHHHKQHRVAFIFHARELAFLVPHLRKNIGRYFGVFFLLLLSSGLSLPGPAITGYVIDKVFISRDNAKLNVFVAVLLVILLLSELVRIIQEYSMLRLSQEFTFSIRVQLIERILKYPLSVFKNFQTGYLAARLDEVYLLGGFFSTTILSLVESLFRFSGALFLISRYSSKMTLISIVVLPLLFEIARRSVGALRTTSMASMETNAKIRGKIQETLAGIEVVKTFAKENREAAEIKFGLRKMIEQEILQNLFGTLSGKLLGIITGVNMLAILWVGGHEIIAGRLTVGQYFAFNWGRSFAGRCSSFSRIRACSARSGPGGFFPGGTRASTSTAGSGPGPGRRLSGSGSTWSGRCWPWSV